MDSFSMEFGSQPTMPKPVTIAQQDCLFPISQKANQILSGILQPSSLFLPCSFSNQDEQPSREEKNQRNILGNSERKEKKCSCHTFMCSIKATESGCWWRGLSHIKEFFLPSPEARSKPPSECLLKFILLWALCGRVLFHHYSYTCVCVLLLCVQCDSLFMKR